MNFNESCKWIDSQQEILLSNLMQLSEINSGTSNVNGIGKVGNFFHTYFSDTADSNEKISSKPREHTDIEGNKVNEEFGDILSFEKRSGAPIQVLLVGHMDTVFPKTHSFQSPQKLDANTLLGPGVADMKGGILVMLTALQAFEASNHGGQLGWRVILNADEETGSHGSVDTLVSAAAHADAGLIYEPALADGTLSRARKGSGNFTVVATGKAAHAGREFELGRNAIMGLYAAANRLEQLTDLAQGITVNIARIAGGTVLNVVPAQAVLQFNVRCHSAEQQKALDSTMKQILQEVTEQSEVAFELSGSFSRPPKTISPANQLLMDWVTESGKQLSIDVQYKDTGGCCDGNNLAAAGLPNVDTLGVLGGQIHTAEEYMLIDSLTERTKLSLSILEKISTDGDRLQALSEQGKVN
ncbi:MAG: hydrolase [Pseudomonadales bacterium]|nr:hydrolase [Pseudomonadales bacterium]